MLIPNNERELRELYSLKFAAEQVRDERPSSPLTQIAADAIKDYDRILDICPLAIDRDTGEIYRKTDRLQLLIVIDRKLHKWAVFNGRTIVGKFTGYIREEWALAAAQRKCKLMGCNDPQIIYPERV